MHTNPTGSNTPSPRSASRDPANSGIAGPDLPDPDSRPVVWHLPPGDNPLKQHASPASRCAGPLEAAVFRLSDPFPPQEMAIGQLFGTILKGMNGVNGTARLKLTYHFAEGPPLKISVNLKNVTSPQAHISVSETNIAGNLPLTSDQRWGIVLPRHAGHASRDMVGPTSEVDNMGRRDRKHSLSPEEADAIAAHAHSISSNDLSNGDHNSFLTAALPVSVHTWGRLDAHPGDKRNVMPGPYPVHDTPSRPFTGDTNNASPLRRSRTILVSRTTKSTVRVPEKANLPGSGRRGNLRYKVLPIPKPKATASSFKTGRTNQSTVLAVGVAPQRHGGKADTVRPILQHTRKAAAPPKTAQELGAPRRRVAAPVKVNAERLKQNRAKAAATERENRGAIKIRAKVKSEADAKLRRQVVTRQRVLRNAGIQEATARVLENKQQQASQIRRSAEVLKAAQAFQQLLPTSKPAREFLRRGGGSGGGKSPPPFKAG